MVIKLTSNRDHVVTKKEKTMVHRLFHELNQEKRMTIIKMAISEFSRYGYSEGSTNRIVKNAGIGKGSLFKYFNNKEDLYFYILDYSITCLIDEFQAKSSTLPKDLFDRVIKWSEIEIAWYINNKDDYKLLKNAFNNDNPVYEKVIEIYGAMVEDLYYKLLKDIDVEQLKYDKDKILNTLRWFLSGFNQALIREMDHDMDIDFIKTEYVERLREYMELLKYGLKK